MPSEPAAPYKTLLHSEAEVMERINELAAEIIAAYDTPPVFVCLLRGGAPFSMLLMAAIARLRPDYHPELDYMTISTYGDERNGFESRVVMDLAKKTRVADRPAVILDDVLDKGLTAIAATAILRGHGASSVDLAVLVQKDKSRVDYPEARFAGFTVGDAWLTGMGMDDGRLAPEANRYAPVIAIACD